MKEYRLAAWPELAPPYHRTAYRRVLNDLSQRYATVAQLGDRSGLRRSEVRAFVELLEARGVIMERERASNDSIFGSLGPIGGWLKKAMT